MTRLPGYRAGPWLVTLGLVLAMLTSSSTARPETRVLAASLVLVGIAWHGLDCSRRRRLPPAFRSPLCVIGVLALLGSLLVGPLTWTGVERALIWSAWLVGSATLGASAREDPGVRTGLLGALLAVFAVVTLFGLAQRLYLFDALRFRVVEGGAAPADASWAAFFASDRARSTFGQANGFAGFLILFVPLAVRGLRTRTRLAYVLAGLVTTGLAASGSRGGAFVALLAAGWAWRSTLQPGSSLRRAVGLATAAGLVLGVLGILAVTSGRLDPARDVGWLTTLHHRGDFWRTAIAMIESRPVTGVGLGLFGACYEGFSAPGAAFSRFAHCGPLTLLAETGLFGLAGLIGVAWSWARTAAHQAGSDSAEPPHESESARIGPRAALIGAALLTALDPAIFFWPTGRLGTTVVLVIALALTFELWARPLARRLATRDGIDPGIRLGLLGFMLHTLVDMDLWVDGLTAAAALLAAVGLQGSSAEGRDTAAGPGLLLALLAVLAPSLVARSLPGIVQVEGAIRAERVADAVGSGSPRIPTFFPAGLAHPLHLEAFFRNVDAELARGDPDRRAQAWLTGRRGDLGHLPAFARREATLQSLAGARPR